MRERGSRAGPAWIIACAAVSWAAPAGACHVSYPPSKHVADWYRSPIRGALVIGRVTDVTPRKGGDQPAFSATAQIETVVSGETSVKRVFFRRDGFSAACGDGMPMPRVGDRWALYLGYRGPRMGEETIAERSYPLDVARQADPKLAETLKSKDAPPR